MKSIDVKSLIIGILGTLLVIACTGSTVKISQSKSTIGRYQMSCIGRKYHENCYVIDTTSAKILGSIAGGDVYKNLGLIDSAVLDD